MSNTRSRTPEPPYCWQNKEALRRIREHLDGDSLLPYALAVYLALTENASDIESEEVTTLQGHLAHHAGSISIKTVQRVLPLLREIGVIDYETPKLRGPITFRVLSVTSDSLSVATNSPNVATEAKTASNPTIEVTEKEQRRTKKGVNRERFDAEGVELPFQSENFIQAWSTWVKHRKEIGHPLTPTATSQQLFKTQGDGRSQSHRRHRVFSRQRVAGTFPAQ